MINKITVTIVRYSNRTYYCKTRGEKVSLKDIRGYISVENFRVKVFENEITGIDITNETLKLCLINYYSTNLFGDSFLINKLKETNASTTISTKGNRKYKECN